MIPHQRKALCLRDNGWQTVLQLPVAMHGFKKAQQQSARVQRGTTT